MDINKNIQDKIDKTFEALDAIETVQVSPFFKDKTMQRMFAEKDVRQAVWSWFTPKLQLATLVCVVVLNVIALTRLEFASDYEDSVSEFAESYGLSNSDENNTFFNN